MNLDDAPRAVTQVHQDSPGEPVIVTTANLRRFFLEIAGDLVEARIDSRIASLKLELTDRIEQHTARLFAERYKKDDFDPLKVGPGVATPPTPPSYPRPSDAVSATVRQDDALHGELEKMRLDLLLEKQKSLSLQSRVQELTNQADLGSHHQARGTPPLRRTGAYSYTAKSDPLYGINRQSYPLERHPMSSTTGVPSAPIQLGPPQYGLEEILPADPDFTAVVSYRRYRLQKMDPDTGPRVSRYVGEYVKLFNPTLNTRKFDGSIPIGVLDFLSCFKRTCDEHGVTEGLALLLLPQFLFGDARSLIEENFELSGFAMGGYRTWPEAVQLLLMNYAKDQYIKDALRTFNNCSMRDDEDEATFGRRLQKHARLCGGIIDSHKLVTRFCDGLPSYIQPMVLGIIPSLPSFNRYQICVDKAAAIGATQRAVLSQAASSRVKASRPDRPKTTRVNQIEATSPSYHDIGYVPPMSPQHLVPPRIDSVMHVDVQKNLEPSDASTTDASFHTAPVFLPNHPQTVGFHPTPIDAPAAPVDSLSMDRRSSQRYSLRQQQVNLPSEICFLCYGLGHRQPNCPETSRPRHDPHLHRRMYENYLVLNTQQQDFLRSIGRAPIILTPPPAKEQRTLTTSRATTPATTTDTAADQPSTSPPLPSPTHANSSTSPKN